MKNTYEKYKNKIINYADCELIVCGFDDDYLIGATKTKTISSFRKISKETFIEEEFKDTHYRYCYIDESTMIKQHPNDDLQTN